MKKILALIILIVIILFALFTCDTNITRAQAPEPLNWMYAAVKCTSLPLTTIQSDYQTFVTQYGWEHNLTTPEQWQASYVSGVNEYLRQFGCPDGLNLEGTALTTWQSNYYPIYRHALGRGAIP